MNLPNIIIPCSHSADFIEKIEANKRDFSQIPSLPTYLHLRPKNLPSLLLFYSFAALPPTLGLP